MTTTCTLTPCALSAADSRRMASASSWNSRPAVAPALTSSGVSRSSTPITPTFVPFTSNTVVRPLVPSLSGPVSHPGVVPVAVSTALAPRNGKSALAMCCCRSWDAVVELVVAERRGVEAPRVLHVDGRLVVEKPRVRRRGADVVTGRQQQAGTWERRELLVEHRCELRRPADGDVAAVDQRRRRLELSVEVGERHDRDRLHRGGALGDLADTRPWECWGSGIPRR